MWQVVAEELGEEEALDLGIPKIGGNFWCMGRATRLRRSPVSRSA